MARSDGKISTKRYKDRTLFFTILAISVYFLEDLQWFVTIQSTAPVHMPHALAMANAVNALPITAEAGKYRGVSSPSPVKRHMTGPLRISAKIIE